MGCLVGVFATVVAAGLGWLAHSFGASFGTIAIVVAVTLVLVTLPVIKYGHVGFGGGGPTDLLMYLCVVSVAAAVAIPRFDSPVACARVRQHLEWVWTVEGDFRSANGYYTDDVEALVGHVGDEGAFDFHPEIILEIDTATTSTFVAKAVHPLCVEDGEPRELSVDQSWEPER